MPVRRVDGGDAVANGCRTGLRFGGGFEIDPDRCRRQGGGHPPGAFADADVDRRAGQSPPAIGTDAQAGRPGGRAMRPRDEGGEHLPTPDAARAAGGGGGEGRTI